VGFTLHPHRWGRGLAAEALAAVLDRAFAVHGLPAITADGAVTLRPGEMFVVPKGTEHKPFTETEVKLLLFEPRGVLNTGDEAGERTAQNDVRI
jgi:hypothetical protein